MEKDENDEDVSLPPHLQKQMEEAVRFAALGGDDYAQQMMLMMRQEKARLAELKRQTEARTAQQKRARAFLLRILIVLLALTITYFFWEAL
ncbi:MAG TPA: hypothetical protein VLL52_03210 [Anaerolineae bacterium]|nr:hypothetical protein [Anaerolineae bacterium]